MAYERPMVGEVSFSLDSMLIFDSGAETASRCNYSCCWGEGCWWA